MTRALLIAIGVAALPGLAWADARSEAKVHVDKAMKLHEGNQLADALDELATAYALDPAPEVLFAIGQVYVKLDDCANAIVFYGRFLSTKPAGASEAREAISACETMKPQKLDAKTEAKRRVASATRLHESGGFSAARAELVLAYALDPTAEVLYAIAQIHVKLRSCEHAIPYYERFLASNPDSTEAQEALQVCRSRVAKPDPDPKPHPVPTEPPVVEPAGGSAWYSDKLGLGLVGGGVVLEAVAIISYRGALVDLDAADRATTYSSHAELVSNAHTKRTAAAVFAGAGLVAAGFGIARLVLHERRPETHDIAIVPSRTGGYITWMQRF